MELTEVRRKAFAMPLNDPAYPPGPYKFYNREFVVITYRTDPDQLRDLPVAQLGPLVIVERDGDCPPLVRVRSHQAVGMV